MVALTGVRISGHHLNIICTVSCEYVRILVLKIFWRLCLHKRGPTKTRGSDVFSKSRPRSVINGRHCLRHRRGWSNYCRSVVLLRDLRRDRVVCGVRILVIILFLTLNIWLRTALMSAVMQLCDTYSNRGSMHDNGRILVSVSTSVSVTADAGLSRCWRRLYVAAWWLALRTRLVFWRRCRRLRSTAAFRRSIHLSQPERKFQQACVQRGPKK